MTIKDLAIKHCDWIRYIVEYREQAETYLALGKAGRGGWNPWRRQHGMGRRATPTPDGVGYSAADCRAWLLL